MKAIILGMLLSSNLMALDYSEQVICKNGVCETREIYTGVSGRELTVNDFKVSQCLFDEKKKIFLRVTEVDSSSKKIVTVTEIEDLPVTVVLKRETVYTDSRDFNPHLKIIPCSKVDGLIINNEESFQRCSESNGKHSFKLFCEKPRKKNF